MDFLSFATGTRVFRIKDEIVRHIVNSRHFDRTKEDPQKSEGLLLFQTPRQQTWLVATTERLYCILDDVRNPEPHINWSMPKEELVSNDRLSLDISSRELDRTTGTLDFGPRHKKWYYTKRLFGDRGALEGVRGFLGNAMRSRW